MNRDLKTKMTLEGVPFRLNFSLADNTTGYENRADFTLDEDDFDYDGDNVDETTPFKDEVLIITGYKLVLDTGVTLGAFIIDGKRVTGQALTAGTYYFDAEPISATGGNHPSLEELLQGFLTCRDKLEVWASASQGGSGIDVSVIGHRLRRIY